MVSNDSPSTGASIVKRAVLDAIQDFSPKLRVNLDITTIGGDTREGVNGAGIEATAGSKESICQGLLSKSIDKSTAAKNGDTSYIQSQETKRQDDDDSNNAHESGIEQQVHSDASDKSPDNEKKKNKSRPVSLPHVIINTDSRLSWAMNDVARLSQIPVLSVSEMDESLAINLDSSASLSRSRGSKTRSSNDNRALVMVKTPTRMLVESVRDAVEHFALGNNFLRVLYDGQYGKTKMESEKGKHA